MTSSFLRRVKVYKKYLVLLIQGKQGQAYKETLKKPTARELAEWSKSSARGIVFSNVARDIRCLIEPGAHYDAEFDLLWRGQIVPEFIERYSETFLASLIKGVIQPTDLDLRLAGISRRGPDGRSFWEPGR